MKRPQFDEAFDLATAWFAAMKEAELAARANNLAGRQKAEREVKRLGNIITPATKQVAAPARQEILKAAMAWHSEHSSEFKFTDFVEHCHKQGIGLRKDQKSPHGRQLTESSIRKVLNKNLGIKGKPGRPGKS